MAIVTLAQINNGLAETLSTATGIQTTCSYDELLSGMTRGNLPLLQVYWERTGPLATGGNTDRTSYQGVIRQKTHTFHVDLYVAPVGHLGQAMGELLPLVDALLDVFEQQKSEREGYFGVNGIRAWKLESADRVIFEYGGGNSPARYIGARFVVTCHVY